MTMLHQVVNVMSNNGHDQHKIRAMMKFLNLNVQMLIHGNSTIWLVRRFTFILNLLHQILFCIGTYQCKNANYEIILCPNGQGGGGSTINWNGNKWALACDFRGNDLTNVRVAADRCGGYCTQTPGCTH